MRSTGKRSIPKLGNVLRVVPQTGQLRLNPRLNELLLEMMLTKSFRCVWSLSRFSFQKIVSAAWVFPPFDGFSPS